jgi:putative serine protease PepD
MALEAGSQPPSASSPAWSRGIILPLLIGVVGAVIGSGATLLLTNNSNSTGAQTGVVRVSNGSPAGPAPLTGVAAVAAKVLPSVVRIDVGGGDLGFLRRGQATGSGVIFRSDGYILTNNHVVEGGGDIQVTLASGKKLPGKLVGSASPSDDIALIKVDATDLTPATIGKPEDLNVGDVAVAVGSPFGLEGSVTAGVISALHRDVNLSSTGLSNAIQTDAPINPGNSGGALANGAGEVIGINTAIATGGLGTNDGVGFAIPMDIAQTDADQIIKTGKAVRPILGIAGTSIPDKGGALVQDVTPGSGADKAGIQSGDIITEVEGTKVTSITDVVSKLRSYKVGDSVSVTFKRDKDTKTAKVELSAPQG